MRHLLISIICKCSGHTFLVTHPSPSGCWEASCEVLTAYRCIQSQQKTVLSQKLKRAGVPPHQLLHFYTTVIRPVLEYASPVSRYSITRAQSYQLESIQKRAVLYVIFSDTRGMSYPNVLFVANLNSLKDMRDRLSRSFFPYYLQPGFLSPSPSSTFPRYFRYFQVAFFLISPSSNLTNQKVSIIS